MLISTGVLSEPLAMLYTEGSVIVAMVSASNIRGSVFAPL